MSAAELWARLSSAGLVKGPQPTAELAGSPWFVRMMLGIAGWIGALFLLAFVAVALSDIVEDATSAMLVGALCCAAAFWMFRSLDGNGAAEQFALAVSLAGQGLLAVGLSQELELDKPAFYFALAAVEFLLAIVIPNFLHRLLAAGGAAIGLALAINQLELRGITAPLLCATLAFIWLDPVKWAVGRRLWRPIGYGLVLALVLVETSRLFGMEAWFGTVREGSWMTLHGPLLGRGLASAILVCTAALLARREGYTPTSTPFLLAVAGAVVMGAIGLLTPGLASALLVLLLGFAAANRLLVGVGIISLLGFATHYYYSLHASLLSKSGLLAMTGIFLLAVFLLLHRSRAKAEVEGNA